MAKKKRTKAERSAAAKASWERRRQGLGPLYRKKGKRAKRTATLDIETRNHAPAAPEVRYIAAPRIAYAVREGDDVFVCFSQDGSLDRKRLDQSGARKLLRELTAILV